MSNQRWDEYQQLQDAYFATDLAKRLIDEGQTQVYRMINKSFYVTPASAYPEIDPEEVRILRNLARASQVYAGACHRHAVGLLSDEELEKEKMIFLAQVTSFNHKGGWGMVEPVHLPPKDDAENLRAPDPPKKKEFCEWRSWEEIVVPVTEDRSAFGPLWAWEAMRAHAQHMASRIAIMKGERIEEGND